MTSTETLAAAMTGQDATNGWDVAYAMSLKQVNALLLQQFLQHPTSPAVSLWVKLEIQETSWILDVELGPPKLEFEAGSQTASLAMELIRGSLITFDDDQVVHSALRIRPVVSRLTGPLALDKTAGGKDSLGQVRVDLGKHAYTPAIAGVDKGVLATEIGEAARTFFANGEFSYLLGWIAPNKDLPAFLNPTDFHFATQKKPGANDACVLLLIHTNGTPGTVGPLPAYPVPEGHSAAMIIAGRVVSGLLEESLNRVFVPLGSKFSTQPSGGAWKVVSSGGELDFGTIGKKDQSHLDMYFSCDSKEGQHEQAVSVSWSGFTVEPKDGALVASWKPQRSQLWAYYTNVGDRSLNEWDVKLFFRDSTLKIEHLQTGKPEVSPDTDEVTFRGEPRTAVKVESDNPIEKFFGMNVSLPDFLIGEIRNRLKPILDRIQLPHVNAFALTNLLFPSNHFISLKEAALSGDLVLTGSLDQPVELSPAETGVTPGGSVSFKVNGRDAKDFTWRLSPPTGSISADGVYTAPKSVGDAAVVVVSARDKKDQNRIGNAMVLVYQPAASGGVAVAPATVMVTPGHKIELSTTDPDGKPVSVTWKLSPALGEIKPKPHAEGRYFYTAPSDCKKATEITATATDASHAGRHGEGRIQLVPRAEVTVSPAKSSVKPGGSVELTAAASGVGRPQFRWGVDPPGSGSVTPQADPSRATYRAPKATPADKSVTVYVYFTEGGAGLAAADITLTG